MLSGVGIDIVDVKRFSASYQRWGSRLLARLFHPDEDYESLSPQRWASRFAAKEAVMKAMGVGLADVSWHDIRIHRRLSGQPVVTLHGRALERGQALGISQIHVSLSHEKNTAVAMVAVSGQAALTGGKPC